MKKVANLKWYESKQQMDEHLENWVYVGRGDTRMKFERSPLANPFSHNPRANATTVASRKVAIKFYKQWLWQQIKNGDKEVIKALEEIDEGTAVVCYCAPCSCHGEVVLRAAKWLREQS